jgi:preprotein translocase subunit SecG
MPKPSARSFTINRHNVLSPKVAMTHVLIIIHVVVSIALIMIVLLQTGKGADMGAAFGGGSSQTLFGSTGASTFLSKLTTIAAVIFMLTSLALAYYSSNRAKTSIMMENPPPVTEQAAPQTETATPANEQTTPTEPANQAPAAPATTDKTPAEPAKQQEPAPAATGTAPNAETKSQ